jgi:transcriptional antiterminator RfaH
MTGFAEPLWYAVHTHPNEEQKALINLKRQNYEAYLPLVAKKVRHARRTQHVLRPFFPRYLFVSLNLQSEGWRSIRSTFGVNDLVCFGDSPTALPHGVVESLKTQQNANGCVNFTSQNTLKPGDRVIVLNGPFSQLVGICEQMTENERVAILLELLGRKVRVLLGVDTVEAA